MSSIEEIYTLLENQCGVKRHQLRMDVDIFDELGVEGDDFSELIESFSSTFNVDISNYRWYFHSNDEGTNLFSFMFRPPNKKVSRIPITPELLLRISKTKSWDISYPNHEVPENRNDISFSWLLLILIIVGLYAFLQAYA